MWSFEHDARRTGFKFIAGIDEAGRGPLAGPVISAAVILPFDFPDPGINDSKKLSPKKREQFFPVIMEHAVCVSTGRADHDEIDRINILAASLKSMERAVNGLSIVPDYLLIDGKFTINSTIAQKAIIKGDSRSISIAAASIPTPNFMITLSSLTPKRSKTIFSRTSGGTFPGSVFHPRLVLEGENIKVAQ